MTSSEVDSHEESLEELIEEVSALRLRYYHGEMLGIDFVSLDGDDIKIVHDIEKRFGPDGLAAFAKAFGPKLEGKTQESYNRLLRDYRRMQENVHGAPYSTNEAEYIRLKLLGVPNLVTNEDYAGFERPISAFGRFLHAYRRGDAVEVYLGAKPVEVVGEHTGYKGIIPEENARTIVFKKPAVTARTGIS